MCKQMNNLNHVSKLYARYAFALIGIGVVLRLIALIASPVQLHGDEAQYWSWAQDLDWGYFSKPPMIAWVIASTTTIFGDAEWAVRLSSPILHAVTASMLFITGRYMFDARTGFWAAALYYLMPAVFLSSGIVSTDVPLLLCWIIALYSWWRIKEGGGWRWALAFGIALGLGILSKYAMLFFIPALVIDVVINRKTLRPNLKWLAGFAIAGLVLLPNILWNAANDFATVSHTAANANLQEGVPFYPLELLEFWISQLVVFGPVTLVLYVIAIVMAWRGKLSDTAKTLSLYVLAPILVISVQALISRANANWAVTSYVAGSLLTAHFIVMLLQRKWVAKGGVWVNIGLGLFAVTGALIPTFADAIGQANAFKRTRGWVETVQAVNDSVLAGYQGERYLTITTDNRLVFYDLNYYGQTALDDGFPVPLKMWLHTNRANNHAEATQPLPASPGGPILIVNYYDDYEDEFREDFTRIERVGDIDIDLGGGKRRQLKLWAGWGYTPTATRE